MKTSKETTVMPLSQKLIAQTRMYVRFDQLKTNKQLDRVMENKMRSVGVSCQSNDLFVSGAEIVGWSERDHAYAIL